MRRIFAKTILFLKPILGSFFTNCLYRILLKTYSKNTANVTSVYGIKLVANWHDATFLMALTGSWGFYLQELLLRHKEEYAFIDIGANFGTFSAVALESKKCLIVVAIEPNPKIFKVLKRNMALNQSRSKSKSRSVFYFNFAIDLSDGVRQLAFKPNNLGSANLSGRGHKFMNVECRNFKLFDEIKVNQTKNLPVIVKIDTEGFEAKVIQEIARSKLKDTIDCIFLEISPLWMSKKDMDGMFANLQEMQFELAWKMSDKVQYDCLYIKKKN